MLQRLLAYVVAVAVAYAAAAVAATQMVLHDVASFGLRVDLAVRMGATWHDLAGMAPVYVPLIAIAFAVAFPVAAGLRALVRFLPRTAVYVAAGAAAIWTAHEVLFMVLGMHPLSVTRSAAGLALQAAAGAAGGLVFAWLSESRRRVEAANEVS